MNKINWTNVLEQAIGGIIATGLVYLISFLRNVLTDNQTPLSPTLIGLIFLILLVVSTLFIKRIRIVLKTIGQLVIRNSKLVISIILFAIVVFGAFSVDKEYILPLIISGTIIVNIFITLWLMSFKQRRNLTIFSDIFNSFSCWNQYEQGQLSHSSSISKKGTHSLLKDTNTDPNGGYKLLGRCIDPGFIFSGWIYRPDQQTPGNGDRLSIENNEFNGYGFTIGHFANEIWIERRVEGRSHRISSVYSFEAYRGDWYKFRFQMGIKGNIELKIFDSSGKNELTKINCEPTREFTSFDRICVRGGYPYYVDDLKIELLK